MTATVSRIHWSGTEPTFPMHVVILPTATDHVLALGSRWSTDPVLFVGFDHDLCAAAPEGPSKRYDLDHGGTAAQDYRRGHDHRRPEHAALGAGRRTEVELDDVTRRQNRAGNFPHRSTAQRGRARCHLGEAVGSLATPCQRQFGGAPWRSGVVRHGWSGCPRIVAESDMPPVPWMARSA